MTNPEKHSADLPADGITPETTDYTTASEPTYSAPDATTPDTTGAVETAPSSVEYDTTRDESGKVKGSFAASTWIALIVGFLLLIVLIIFILQKIRVEGVGDCSDGLIFPDFSALAITIIVWSFSSVVFQ